VYENPDDEKMGELRHYVHVWRRRFLWFTLTLSCALVYPFVAGHSLHNQTQQGRLRTAGAFFIRPRKKRFRVRPRRYSQRNGRTRWLVRPGSREGRTACETLMTSIAFVAGPVGMSY
jgi:hypothetical protein